MTKITKTQSATFKSEMSRIKNFTVRQAVEHRMLTRMLVLLLLTALLSPIIIWDGSTRSTAAAPLIKPIADSAPVAAPPEAFASSIAPTSGGIFTGTILSSFFYVSEKASSGYDSMRNVITPTLPEGFENAVLPTFGERVGNAWSSLTTDPSLDLSAGVNLPNEKLNDDTKEIKSSNALQTSLKTSAAKETGPVEESTNGEPELTAADSEATVAEPPAETNVEPLSPPTTPGIANFDFNGDGKADIARFQSTLNLWTIKNSAGTATATLGSSGAIIVPADYDGDGKTDVAVWNQYSADWTINKSSGGSTAVNAFGLNGDIPVPGHYNGTGIAAEIAVFRPSNGTWYTYRLSDGFTTSIGWGQAGDIPVAGDYNNDGITDRAVFRPSNGYWYILMPGNGGSYTYFQWGAGTDVPVPGDYAGDGRTDYAVFRPSNGTWYIQPSDNSPYISKTWGNYGDQPVPADYDGDGKTDVAVWRPTSGVWYIVKSIVPGMATYLYDQLGIPGDTAVSSAYVKKVGGAVPPAYLAMARLAPKNATGGTNVYSRNFGWGTSLVNLPGRAGLDAGFGISYNSLVWTKEPNTNTMVFDADYSNVAPGFRMGFPVIEPSYYNPLTQQFSYLMVTPLGGHVEFRQTAASNVYETADSSYAQLTVIPGQQNQGTESSTILVRTTDGAMMTYQWRAGSYKLSEIKDRNGNYISVVHDEQHGLLRSMTDTLGRVVTVEYDSEFSPIAVKQDWKSGNGDGSTVSHTYTTFTYTSKQINPNFGMTNIFGPTGGAYVKVLEQIIYPTGGRTVFEYNDYGQVVKVRNLAADLHELNYVRTNLSDFTATANQQNDCPRFTKTYNKVENFNNNQETVTHNTFATNQTYSAGGASIGALDMTEVWLAGDPHAVHSKAYYHPAGNWSEGLPLGSVDTADSVQQRWTRTVWTQDDTGKNYKVNPRIEETKVGDSITTKRTKIDYYLQSNTNISMFGLPSEVRVYDADQTTVLKKATTDYKIHSINDSAYLNRRIIGLPKEQKLYEGESESTLMSKVTYTYDEGNFSDTNLQQNLSSVIRHDNINYGSSFITGRGNLTSTTRCNISSSSATVCGGGIASSVKYNIAGAIVAQIDPLGRTSVINYEDSFNDTTDSRNTYAYPTKMAEAAYLGASNNYSTLKYRFDTGANVRAVSPAPNNASGNGKISERIFDPLGRLERERIIKDSTEYNYIRYEYPTNQIQSKSYTLVTAGQGETLSESWTDGAGRVRKSRTELPTNYSGSLTEYDIFGRVTRSTVPTEIDSSWNPTGDDNRGLDSQNNSIWLWNSVEYDWKGRVTHQINTDGTDKIIAYEGCGCAGKQVTKIEGEEIFETDWQGNNPVSLGRRTQKTYQDILGRTVKMQVMNFNGTSTFLTTDVLYNGRDQATTITRTDNVISQTQVATMTYDGHGRLKTQHRPEQDTNTSTVYNYNADDRISSVVDARGASTNYVYNTRGLLSQVYYNAPVAAQPENQIRVPATTNYEYDALGNRTAMTEQTSTATGAINKLMDTTYSYDALSRLSSETRAFNDTATGFNQSFTFNYQYNLAGQLTEFSDSNDATRSLTYERDKIGRVVSLKNNATNPFGGVQDYATNIQYRAFGAVKSLIYGTQGTGKQLTQDFNNRLQLSHFDISGGEQTFYNPNLGTVNKYYADGQIKSADDSYDETFDRLYKYDYAGRISVAKSGLEASDETQTTADRPYNQTYSYNSFGDLTGRTGKVWTENPTPMTATYTNNRNDNLEWVYDANGRNTYNKDIHSRYDAGGRRYEASNDWQNIQTFDGDGQRIKQTEDIGNSNSLRRKYYVNSSVLGLIYEVAKTGTSNNWIKTGTVTLNGQKIAILSSQAVGRFYENPTTGATRGQTYRLASEPDPMGINNGTNAPPVRYEGGGEGVPDIIIPRFADALNLASGCTIDGMAASCDSAAMVVDLMSQYNRNETVKTTIPIYNPVDGPMPDFTMPGAFPTDSPTAAYADDRGGNSSNSTFLSGTFLGSSFSKLGEPVLATVQSEHAMMESLSPITTTLSNRVQTQEVNRNKKTIVLKAKIYNSDIQSAIQDCANELFEGYGVLISSFSASGKDTMGEIGFSFARSVGTDGEDIMMGSTNIKNNAQLYSSDEITAIARKAGDKVDRALGVTFGLNKTNYTAKDAAKYAMVGAWAWGYTSSDPKIVSIQVHEFGHSLANFLHKQLYTSDGAEESGQVFQSCVDGKLEKLFGERLRQ